MIETDRQTGKFILTISFFGRYGRESVQISESVVCVFKLNNPGMKKNVLFNSSVLSASRHHWQLHSSIHE